MRTLVTALIAFVLCLGATMQAGDQKKKLPDPSPRKDAILKLFVAEFVPITPGKGKYPESFLMGSEKGGHDNEKPAHKVTFKYPFAIAKYEVTQELYQVVTGKNPAQFQGLRNGMDKVNWNEANEFCEKATKMLRDGKLIKENERIRLPSEAEWEYCCRAGTTTAWSFGDDVNEIGKYSWFKDNSAKEDPPVGKKLPNPWGLYDMHGYVWEWCADAWHPNYEGAPNDGRPWTAGDSKDRVIRGGAYPDEPDLQRSAYRGHAELTKRSGAIGFRCVKDSLRSLTMSVGVSQAVEPTAKAEILSITNPSGRIVNIKEGSTRKSVHVEGLAEGVARIALTHVDGAVEVIEVTVVRETKK